MKRVFTIVCLLMLLTCAAVGAPRNVILFIGDGMGVAHVAAARIANGGADSRLAMDEMPVTGLVATHSANSLITDSAAAGTALAAGVKTNNGMVSVTPDGRRARSILEAARELGKATGIVTTTSVTDATPAVFAAHIDDRGRHAEIAGLMLAARVDVIMGGGRAAFIPSSKEGSWRDDERDLLAEAGARGYAVVSAAAELNDVKDGRLLGLFSMGNLTTKEPEPPLSGLTTKAIEILSKDPDGFFLMVEGGLIDKYGHANDFEGMIRQLLEFDCAVARGLSFAESRNDTLIIVTADHETGGLTLCTEDDVNIKACWSTGGHTAAPVPLYAAGSDASKFSGFMDNTDVCKRLAALWNVKCGVVDGTTCQGLADGYNSCIISRSLWIRQPGSDDNGDSCRPYQPLLHASGRGRCGD